MLMVHLLLLVILYAVTTHFRHKIRNLPPTPFPTLPIIGHLYLFKIPLHRSLSKLSNQYGDIIFLQFGSRKVLVVSSPSAAEECFTKNDVIFANRPLLIAGKHVGFNFRSLAWAPYGDYWRNLRKIFSLQLLSTHRIQLLSGIRIEEVKLMIRRLFNAKDEVVNMKVVLFELAMNVMMSMIAGKRYYGDDVVDVEDAQKFRNIVKDTFRLIGSNLADFLPIVKVFGGLEKQMMELQKRRDAFMQDLIEKQRRKSRTSSEKHRWCMIDVLLGLQESEPEQYDDEVIKSLVLTLLSAGTDTTAATIEWNMSVLLNNPEIMRKAQDEIDLVVGHDRIVNEADVSNLSYLHCIIKETSRLYPVSPLLVPHESSEECRIGGYRVPGGTMLLVNMWAIQRDPTIWEDPTKFKPERFEGHEGTRDGFKFIPFGSGRRSCPGEGLAVRTIGLGLASLLQCFEWKRVGEEMEDMTEGNSLNMPKAKPLLALCNPRPRMLKLLSLF